MVLFPQGNFWQLIINFRRLIISQSNYWKVIILPSFYLLSENEVNISRPRSEIFFVMTERTRLISYLLYSLFIMDLSLQSIKTNTWPWLANNFKKHITSMSCTLESPRYSQVILVSGYPFWQLSIDHNILSYSYSYSNSYSYSYSSYSYFYSYNCSIRGPDRRKHK